MRLLHTSDWHLGASEESARLMDDQKFFIDEIVRIVREEKIDAVMIAGDVYDRSVASAEAVSLYDYAMTRLCSEASVKVLEIAGNHDSSERLASCRELLSKAGLIVTGSLTAEPAVAEFDDVQIFMLPWFTEEKVKSLFPDKKDDIRSMTDAYRVVTDSLKEAFDKDKKHIVIAHAFITDSETSTSDRAAEIGFATQVSADVFEGFDYVALGHLHGPQDVNDHIRYSGTPMPYSFGREESQEKSVTVIDTDTMERKIIALPLLHARTSLEGTLEEVLHADISDEARNGYIRIRLTDSYVGLQIISELRSIYPNLLEISGRNYEGEDTTISLSMDEYEKIGNDPMEIFTHFCRDQLGGEPIERHRKMFMEVIDKVEEGRS